MKSLKLNSFGLLLPLQLHTISSSSWIENRAHRNELVFKNLLKINNIQSWSPITFLYVYSFFTSLLIFSSQVKSYLFSCIKNNRNWQEKILVAENPIQWQQTLCWFRVQCTKRSQNNFFINWTCSFLF